jgi:hypothetical protein
VQAKRWQDTVGQYKVLPALAGKKAQKGLSSRLAVSKSASEYAKDVHQK